MCYITRTTHAVVTLHPTRTMYRDTFGRFLKQKIEYIDTCDPMPVIKIKYSTFRSRTYLYMSRR